MTSAQLSGLTGLVRDDTKGLIDIGATKIKDVEAKIEGGKIAYTELSSIAGVTNDTIKSVTVTKLVNRSLVKTRSTALSNRKMKRSHLRTSPSPISVLR